MKNNYSFNLRSLSEEGKTQNEMNTNQNEKFNKMKVEYTLNSKFSSLILGIIFFFGVIGSTWGQNTYYYVGGNSATVRIDNASSVNWSTSIGGTAVASITPSNTNIFIFDGSDISSVTGLQTGAIVVKINAACAMGQLKLQNNADVSLAGNSTTSFALTIGNAASSITGFDLSIASGCSLKVQVNTSNLVSLSLASGNTATIDGTYVHNYNGGVIPTATWATTSTLNITGITSTAPTGLAQTFGNFTWNCASQSASLNLNLGNATTAINGNFNLTSTGSPTQYTLRLNDGNASSPSLTVNGNVNIGAGGALNLAAAAGTANLFIKGNLTLTSGGRLIHSSTTKAKITFNGTTDQTFTDGSIGTFGFNATFNPFDVVVASGSTLILATNLSMNAFATTAGLNPAFTVNGTLNCSTFSVLNSVTNANAGANAVVPTFTLSSGATIITANSAGLTSSGATGSIQVTGTRTYSSGANYDFRGSNSGAFTTSPTANTINNLTINRSAGVTLDQPLTVAGTLTLTSGILTTTSTNILTISNTSNSAISGASTTNFISGPLKWSLPTISSTTNYVFPVGKGGTYYPITLSPSSTTTPVITVEAFNANSGGTGGSGIGALSTTEYWNATINSGTWTQGTVSLTRQAALGTLSIITRSSSLTGTYSSLAGTVSGTSINTSDATGNTLGFFALAAPTLPEPTNQVTNLAVSSVTTSNIPLTWTAAVTGSQAPDGYLIKLNTGTVDDPFDGTDPANVTAITSGAANAEVTPQSAAAYSSFTNFAAGTMYNFNVYSYTNSGANINFKTGSPATLNHATLPNAATLPVFASTTSSGTTLSWTPSGYSSANHSTLVFVKATSAVTAGTPTNAPSTYTANTAFGSGVAYQGDASAYCVYNGDGTSVSITGLSGNTTYHIYIVSVVDAANSNGNRSYSSGLTGSVTTACGASSIPWNEGFESGFTNNTAVGGCWTQSTVTGTQVWTANSSATNYNRTRRTGTFNAFLYYNNEDWMFYPVQLTGGTNYTFEVYARQDMATSTDANITLAYGSSASSGSMTIITGPTGIINGNYQSINGAFTPATSGTYYMGIKGFMNGTPYYISIDDISVTVTPACASQPTSLSSSSVAATTATITWVAASSAPANGYEYYVSTSSTAPTAGTSATGSVSAGVTTANLTSLLATTTYYFWVRSNCNGTDKSVWAGESSFTTLCSAVSSFPYTEGFESLTVAYTLPSCMTASPVVSSGGKNQTYIASATGTNSALVAKTGSKFASVYYSPNAEGYFFSPALQLTGGTTYSASVFYRTDGVAWPTVGLKYGTSATIAGMTTSIASVTSGAATTYTEIKGSFTPSSSGTYYVAFYADNTSNNAPNYASFDDFSVCQIPNTPGSISGTTSQCPSLTSQTYSISAVAGATSYTWTVPTGWSITAGSTTNSITVTTGTSGQNGNITVTATNACGTSSASSQAVTVLSTSTAPAITGSYSCSQTSVSGTGINGSTINVIRSGSTIGTTTVSSGVWTATVSSLVTSDAITATQTESGKCVSAASTSITVNAAPGCISTFTPANSATSQNANGITISWSAVTNATSYDVYFGTDASATNIINGTNQSEITFSTGAMSGSTTYYWKIVPRNACGAATGCSIYSFTTGLSCTPPTYSYSSQNVNCYGQSTGSITMAASGGQSPIQYSKDGGLTWGSSNIFSSLTSGIYTIVVKGNDGCVGASNGVTLTQPSAALSASSSGGGSGCAGNTLNFTGSATGGTSPYSYSWDPATGLSSSSEASPTLTIASTGTYTLTVTDNLGCTSSASALTVTNNSPAAPTSVSGSSPICLGDAMALNATSAGNTINWYDAASGGNLIGASASGVNLSYTPASAGSLTYYAEASYIAGTTPGSQTFDYSGSVVNWTVPAGVTSINVDARGAQGGIQVESNAFSPGNGARIVGTISVTPGAVLKILVGGKPANAGSDEGAGGGGGSFLATSANVPLVVAGGGGGEGADASGDNASITTSGTTPSTGGAGGTLGNGGGITSTSTTTGSGGGGFNGNGTGACTNGNGLSFINGGTAGISCGGTGSAGGFGGGGGGSGEGAGGGGGYSGGGGGNSAGSDGGGGGGSYCVTTPTTTAATQTGNGQIIITYTQVTSECPSASRTATNTITVNPKPLTSNLGATAAASCAGVATVTVSSTTLATGTYTVTYNVSGTNTVASTTASMSFTAGSPGSGTFTTSTLATDGLANVVNITAIAFPSTSCSSSVSTSTAAFTTSNNTTWTGTTSTDWHTASNWSCGLVPTASSVVTIASASNQPAISAAASCASITLANGTSLTINSGQTLTAAGNWTNNGATISGTGIVLFNGTTTIAGSSSTTFPNLTVSGAVINGIATTVNGNFILSSGSYKQNGGFALTVNGNYTQSGGAIDFAPSGQPTSSIFLKGNYTQSGGTITTTAFVNNGIFVFNGLGSVSSPQVLTAISGTSSIIWYDFTINSGTVVSLGSNIVMYGSSVGTGSASTINVNGDLVCGTYTISAASSQTSYVAFNLNSGATLYTANVNGVVAASGTITNATTVLKTFDAAANYVFNGASNQTTNFSNAIMNNLTISNTSSAITSLNAATTVNGNVLINSGATLDVSATNYALSCGTNWTNNGTFNGRTGTVTFNNGVASASQLISGTTTFNNLTCNGVGTTSYNFGSATTTIAGVLTVSNGTMVAGTSTVIFTGASGGIAGTKNKNFNNLQINNGATITVSDVGGDLSIIGDYVNNGTLTVTSTLNTTFKGGIVQSMSGNGASTFGHFFVNSSTTLNAGAHNFSVSGTNFNVSGVGSSFNGGTGTATMTGAVVVGSGNGTINFNNLTISGSVTNTNNKNFSVSGNYSNNGTYTAGTEMITFNATATGNTLSGNMTGSNKFYSLLFNGSNGGWTFNSNVELGNDFTISDGSVNFNNYNLTIGGNFANSNGLNGFVAGTGSVIFNHASNIQTLTMALGSDFSNIQHTGAGTLQLQSDLAMTGNMTNSAGTLSVNGYNIVIGGNWTNSATFNPGAAGPSNSTYVALDGDSPATQTIDNGSSQFNDLRVIGTATITMVTPAQAFGDVVVNGPLASTAALILTGGESQTISSNYYTEGPIPFQNLTVNKTAGAVVTLTKPVRVTGTLTMTQGDIVSDATNILEVGSSASSVGSVSWAGGTVRGPMKRWFAASANSSGDAATVQASGIFPVGADLGGTKGVTNRFAQVNFTGTPSGGYIIAEYKTGLPSPSGYSGLPLNYSSGSYPQAIQNAEEEGYWDITPYSSAGVMYGALDNIQYTLKLRLQNPSTLTTGWTANNDGNNLYDAATIRLIRAKGASNGTHGNWELAGTHSSAIETGNGDYYITSSGITGFSWFNGGGNNQNPLPVELLSFNGTCNEGMVDLLWQTASEFNSSHFDVEKSRDGENWQLLTTLPSAGTSNELITYQSTDQNGTDGNNYFRLRQVDNDGKEKLYAPINVSCIETTAGYFSSFPNPSGSAFQVIVNNKDLVGTCVINIVDASGKVIEQRDIEVKDGINMFVINQEFTPGMYFLNISNGSKSTPVLRHAIK